MGYSADDLLREIKSKASNLINEKFSFDKAESDKIAKSVALAAIKFEFLKIAPEKKIIFSWERALNFEGNSGPYAQYMHARATRILEGAPENVLDNLETPLKISDNEFALVKLISKEMAVLEKATYELRPNVITEYINELASAFATFYEQSPILKADSGQEKIFRIRLTACFRDVMRNMLQLLGMEALEKM